jgi:hypothetical protein
MSIKSYLSWLKDTRVWSKIRNAKQATIYASITNHWYIVNSWPAMSRLSSLKCSHQRAYCSNPQVIYEHGEPWWMISTGKTKKLGEKPVSVSLCPSQNPYELTHTWTRMSTVTGWYLIIWTVAQQTKSILTSNDGLIIVKVLHLNITAIIRPMDQGETVSTK